MISPDDCLRPAAFVIHLVLFERGFDGCPDDLGHGDAALGGERLQPARLLFGQLNLRPYHTFLDTTIWQHVSIHMLTWRGFAESSTPNRDHRNGAATIAFEADGCELTSLNALEEARGIGTA